MTLKFKILLTKKTLKFYQKTNILSSQNPIFLGANKTKFYH